MKKLVLNKETLRDLTEEDLSKVAGGATTTCPPLPQGTGCDLSGITCEPSFGPCGTCLP